MQLWKKLEFVHVGEHFDIDGASFGLMPLMKDILSKEQGHLTEFEKRGNVKVDLLGLEEDDDDFDNKFGQSLTAKYLADFFKMGARLIHKTINESGDNMILMWEDGLVDLSIDGTYVGVKVMSQREELILEIKKYFKDQWAEVERTGHIYAITKYGPNLNLSSLGNAGIPLVVENYTPKVMEDYKYVIKDLRSEVPSGRITVMRGAPGTGKTHLIRAMLLEVKDALFVLVNPDMIVDLAGPELLPLLLSYRGGREGPIVLVLEDADRCLVKRAADNISSIQSLLNMGDGILGSMLDLRIIATTNAKKLELEEALTRKGRISKDMEVGPLDAATAHGVYNRLLPGKKLPEALEVTPHVKFQIPLGDVYHVARENGWAPKARKNCSKSDDDYDGN
jgi:ATPase family associated with various cellular activities (AAA)